MKIIFFLVYLSVLVIAQKDQKQVETFSLPKAQVKDQKIQSIQIYEKLKGSHSQRFLFLNNQKTQLQLENVKKCTQRLKIKGQLICLQEYLKQYSYAKPQVITNPGLYQLAHDIQYFQIATEIDQIIINWAQNKIYLIDTSTKELLLEIFQGNIFFKNHKKQRTCYLVIGNKGNTISFLKMSYFSTDYFYLLMMVPAIIVLILYLANQFKTYQNNQQKFRLDSSIQSINKECAICICNDSFGYRITLVCNHTFHKSCVMKWYQTNLSCPYCRSSTTQLHI